MQACSQPVDPHWYILMLPLTCIGIGIVFGTSVKQYPAFTLNSAVGFVVYYFLSKVIGPTSIITPSVGAFALGLTANIYGRITKRLTFVMLMGGVIILVPGSIGKLNINKRKRKKKYIIHLYSFFFSLKKIHPITFITFFLKKRCSWRRFFI